MTDNKTKKPKRLALKILFLIVLAVASVIIIARQKNTPYQRNTGFIFGTIYNVSYQSSHDLQPEIEAELKRVDASLSPFNKQSIITAVNNNRPVKLDDL